MPRLIIDVASSTSASARPQGGGAGRRPKHVPQRMCVACRERDAKRQLIRVVRTPEGSVEIDVTGKRNGRGAYLCNQPACWDRALKSGALARALNITLTPKTVDTLQNYASGLSGAVEVAKEPVR